MKRSPGQWNAWCESGKDLEEQRTRLAEVPRDMRASVIAHVRTANKLAAEAAKRMEFLFGSKKL